MINDDYAFIPEIDETTGIMAVLGFFLIVVLILMAFAILTYVFQSIGLYTIAKRRGIKNPWLAWIPYGSTWIQGSISDQYNYVVKGQVKNRRVIMLVLSIASAVVSFISSNVSGGLLGLIFEIGMDYEPAFEEILAAAGGTLGVILLLGLISFVIGIVSLVFSFMSLYDLYASCNPGSSTLFLVLSIVFTVTQPFLVFASRNKDLGMPPRRPQLQPQPAITPARDDPWENNPQQ